MKNQLQLIMEPTSWYVVWFAFPNEDWIHPQPLTVCGVEYAALHPVSMEILRSCCPPPPTPPLSTPPPMLLHKRDLGQGVHVCVCVGYNGVLTGAHTRMTPLTDMLMLLWYY